MVLDMKRSIHLLGVLDSPIAPIVRYIARLRSASIGFRTVEGNGRSLEYPGGASGAVCFSLDFELAWGKYYGDRRLTRYYARTARRNIPLILKAFDRCGIAATWATVGHLFLERCESVDARAHPDMPRPEPYRTPSWEFKGRDWYACDPSTNLAEDPEWYGLDLVKIIQASSVGHEFGTHGFSHTSLGDDEADHTLVAGEIAACRELMTKNGLTLRSLVFPGNLEGNFSTLADAGVLAYRGFSGENLVDRPRRNQYGLWDIHQTMHLIADGRESERLDVAYTALDAAEKSGGVAHFWLHPAEMTPYAINSILSPLLDEVAQRHAAGRIWTATMAEIAELSESNHE